MKETPRGIDGFITHAIRLDSSGFIVGAIRAPQERPLHFRSPARRPRRRPEGWVTKVGIWSPTRGGRPRLCADWTCDGLGRRVAPLKGGSGIYRRQTQPSGCGRILRTGLSPNGIAPPALRWRRRSNPADRQACCNKHGNFCGDPKGLISWQNRRKSLMENHRSVVLQISGPGLMQQNVQQNGTRAPGKRVRL
jgi:hypothetical protein